MNTTLRKVTNLLVSFVVLMTMMAPSLQSSPVSAQAQTQTGLHREYNTETGKVTLITGENHEPISVLGPSAVNMTPEAQSQALVQHFASEFGLTNPAKELKLSEISQPDAERVVSKYQQIYQGVPVMAGELMVNANKKGELLSMNGEVSQGLSLDTKPELKVESAVEIAEQGMVKWYGGEVTDYTSTQSSLWIVDETLLRLSTRPANLVWRIEMVSTKEGAPIRELVLVDAKTGNVSLHFNQVDTVWGEDETSKVNLAQGSQQQAASSKAPLNPEIPAAAGTTWYVATTGNDANDCLSPTTPCATINGAIGKAAGGDTIKVAVGTYTGSGTEVVLINKSITLSGGWNESFSAQDGTSIVDGLGVLSGIVVSNSVIVMVDRFTIQDGYAGSGFGGGIFNSGTLTFSHSNVSGNKSLGGGGGIFNEGTMVIKDTSISGNSAGNPLYSSSSGGGGILNYGAVVMNSSTINNNTIIGYYKGGGINNLGTFVLNNTTVSGNTGPEGIYNINGAITLNNSTVSDNQVTIYALENNFGTVTLHNSIIAGNSESVDCFDISASIGSMTSMGYNLIGNTSCGLTAASGDLFGTAASPISPRLASLQDNGGLTLTHALMIGSPAIDAGNECLLTDQRGIARPVGERCDIGAYEGSVPWMSVPRVNTYTANSTPGWAIFLCSQTQPNCTNGSNPHADAAHKFAIGTYNFYAEKSLRDSIDNNGMLIRSTVHYCEPGACPYANAFWNGSQMVYGDAYGFPLADDVVAHELTHGVTQYESNLFYFYQSGAINESFSDVWGEYYDQTNALGTDTPAVKWLMGEDVSGSTPIRSMSNPPTYGDPDKMSSANYDESDLDNGGVHTNSGVNNKAVFLMVDGGSFNSKTVSALGWDKTAAIYYEAQTNLLSSGADYSDLYYAIQQACANLTGQLGITAGDCQQVKNALDAVEMNTQPAAGFNPDAPFCAAGTYPTPLFQDDMESGTSNWAITNAWSLQSGYASSPAHMWYGDDYYPSSESALTMANGILLPSSSSMFLHFKHAFAFEYYLNENYDGGVLEYSTNNGTTWTDASSKFVDGQNYKGTILNYSGTTNVLKGRSAFVRDSHGYVSSRYNLSSLGGQTVKFRWRFATDNSYYYLGWMVDDVQIYTCGVTPPVVVSSTRTNVDPNSSTTVNFTVKFSQSVTGVDISDFSLTTYGAFGAHVSGVSGAGTTYTVTVNTGSGSGTIQLNIVDNDSIVNTANIPLGGAGAGNGNFTSGETYTIRKSPVINSFTATTPANSLNIPITAFTAWDTNLTGYLITTSATPPLIAAVGWSPTPPTFFMVASEGSYTLYPWAKDAEGNVSDLFASPPTIIVDIAVPSVTNILRLDADPNSATSVHFNVTFSEPVTHVDSSDFSLTNSGVLGAAVSGVSGSGSAYTVTVTTGSGSGTIQLNVTDNDSILDAASNSLGGSGAGNGDFILGEIYTITKTWIFGDVPNTYWSWGFIESLYNAGITGGCSAIPLNYCPTNQVTRAQMAIFLVRAMHGVAFVPPTATGVFSDVPVDSFGANFIEQLAADGITSGCGGGNFCPNSPVTRASMAVFLVRAKHGVAFVPPTATGIFTDVPVGSFGADFIEQLAADSITSGCGAGIYCPSSTVKRDSMAVFLVRAFNLP